MHTSARVVVIGSGLAGSSIAYHLTALGWREVVVLEQGDLCSGTTAHAPGLVGQLRPSRSLTKLLMDSVALYTTLQVDGQPGYFRVGSLRLASSPARLEELRRLAGSARSVGLEAELLTPRQAQALFPPLSLAGVCGALFLPGDGTAHAPILARALTQRAHQGGATFYTATRVTGIEVRKGRVQAVQSEHGRIACEIVVVAAGIWSPYLGRMAGVNIPLLPMQHQYVVTAPVPELSAAHSLPNLRDPDLLVYYRQEGAGLVLGGYERHPVIGQIDVLPGNTNPTVGNYDKARFSSLLTAGSARVPALAQATLLRRVNGLEAFTPDGDFLLGEAPQVRGFWVACGFCAHGVSGAGGVGKVLAEWIVAGTAPIDVWPMDIRRFSAHTASRAYLSTRVPEIYRTYYDINYPLKERSSARNLRLSPLYQRLRNLEAVFGEKAGWERPEWFAANAPLAAGQGWPRPQGWAARHWSPAIGAEHQATRERVALFDETSFSKIEITGPGALEFLQYLSANQLDRPCGTITYTQLLNARGGIECDLTVTRLDTQHFLLITGTASGPHDLAWIRKHAPEDGSVVIRDITSSRCCIGVWGPRARDLLQAVSEHDFSNAAFPYLSAQEALIGEVPVLALRVTYVGAAGWELYAPMEYGLRLWDTLWEAAQPLGGLAAGYRAIEALRLEKGYRAWGADIHSEYNPYETGLGFAVKLHKGAFLGRDALLASRAQGITRKLCCLVLDDANVSVLGGEPVLDGARVAGYVTSGGYGYTVRQSIAYAYLPLAYAAVGTRVELELFAVRYAATVVREPLYDPEHREIKA
ncbi:MAG TPA: FAD-dependent oxidoreductase [Ktedonobacteraceae bacterium]|jgi:4-methylaminobutanoate oxidase (formaldehyde-forming)